MLTDTPGNDPPTLAEALRQSPFRRKGVSGQRAGPYVVEDMIAQGAMGAVYRARHEPSGRAAALKFLLLGGRGEGLKRRRFLREAETLAKLSHPGIVQVYDCGEQDGLPWMAMELVEGRCLNLEGQEVEAVVRALTQVAEALAGAHALGIVHRDLKPDNILVRTDGRPVVTDFGVAKDLAQSSSLTRSGTAVGTPVYMAPEQVRGDKPTPATDVHALGVILYEGLTGRIPWDFGDNNMLAIMSAITSQRPPAPSKERAGVSPALDEIVARCLEKDPARRYPDAGALGDALRAAAQGRYRPAAGRRGLAVGAAVGVGLAAICGGLLYALRPERPASPPTPEPARADPATPPPPPAVPERELVLQPGPVAGHDSYVRNDGLYANDNFGSENALIVGDRNSNRQFGDLRALLWFDLARLPAGAEVVSAELVLDLGTRTGRGPQTLRVYGLGGAELWREGTNLYDDFLDGVCWDGAATRLRYPQGNSNKPEFTQPPADGVDYGRGEPGLVDSVSIHNADRRVAFDVTELVRRHAADSHSNRGLRVAHHPEGPPFDDGYVGIPSSDHPDVDRRPRLVVRYRGEPSRAGLSPDEELRLALEVAEPMLREARKGTDVVSKVPPGERTLALAQGAIEAAPFLGDAYFVRGFLRGLLGKNKAANMDLRTATRVLRPCQDPRFYGIRAQVRFASKDPRGALEDLEKALAEKPGDPQLLSLQAEVEAYLRRR